MNPAACWGLVAAAWVLASMAALVSAAVWTVAARLQRLTTVLRAVERPRAHDAAPRADPEGVLNQRLSDVQTRRFAPPMLGVRGNEGTGSRRTG